METIELSRKQLYDLVWSTPISKLTQQYAISNEGFKKICKKFEIPMPQNGFWLKLKYNKKVKIEKLKAHVKKMGRSLKFGKKTNGFFNIFFLFT